jgi:hypothetical protein
MLRVSPASMLRVSPAIKSVENGMWAFINQHTKHASLVEAESIAAV